MLDLRHPFSIPPTEDTPMIVASSRSPLRRPSGRPHGVVAASGAIACLLLGSAGAKADDYEIGQVQLQLSPGVTIETINARYGTTTLKALDPLSLVDVPSGSTEDGVIALMEVDPDIAEVEYAWEGETPEGTRAMVVAVVGGTITQYQDQGVVSRIHLPEIQQHTLGEGVTIAVIDGGVNAAHPALAGAILPNGWDFVDNDADPSDTANGLDDDNDTLIDEGAGHGTMIAGIVHLVAPGAKILPIRVMNDEGRGETFTVAQGIRYAIEHGADVINLSLGLDSHVFTLRHEVEFASASGITVVGAAGNQAAASLLYPAREEVCVSVTALDSLDIKASFANYHHDVNVSAPGDGILAPYYDGGWAIGAGTSFASPFVAGQAAPIRALNPGLSAWQVRSVIKQGVVPIDQIPGARCFSGTGRIDGLATSPPPPRRGLGGAEGRRCAWAPGRISVPRRRCASLGR
ncbi:MAG: S8 family serine peptidase [Candidatus Eisenbacteria bacterium]